MQILLGQKRNLIRWLRKSLVKRKVPGFKRMKIILIIKTTMIVKRVGKMAPKKIYRNFTSLLGTKHRKSSRICLRMGFPMHDCQKVPTQKLKIHRLYTKTFQSR